MEHFDVVIVGAGPAGFNAAKTVKELYPEKRLLVINDRKELQTPCSIPWVVAGKISPRENAYPLERVREFGELLVERAVSVEPSTQRVFTETKGFTYEKLIIATGWRPRVLNLKNQEVKGVYYIDTSTQRVKELQEKVKEAEKIVLIGGGLISIGFADAIASNLKKEVTILEAAEQIAPGALSREFSLKAEEGLKALGVRVLKGTKATGLKGEGRVTGVETSRGELPADLVLIFAGFLPNSRLAVEAGIRVKEGFIEVDDYLRTSADGVLAAGNCALHTCPVTGREIPAMFASVSARDGRVAGINTTGPEVKGKATVTAGMTQVNGELFGFTGYTEEALLKEGIEFKSVKVKTADAYPKAIGAKEIEVEALFSKEGRLIGLQARGRSRAVWAVIEAAARLIEEGATAKDIVSKVSPAFPTATPSPLLQPIQEAALKCF